MNATVTKTAKKTAPAKTVSKAAAAPAKAKSAAATGKKSPAAPIGKTLASALKKPPEAAKPSAPAATKAARPGGSPAAKTPAAAAKKVNAASPKKSTGLVVQKSKTPVKMPVTAVAKAPVKPATKTSPPKAAKKGDNESAKIAPAKESRANSQAVKSNASMSANNAADVFVDKIQKTVVSKVSEVATKTTKPTSAMTDGATLTEAQILKMGEKDYMNAAQLAFFKTRLQQLEKDLLRNAGETTEHLRETVLVPDPADRATIEEEHALELRTRDRERKLLKKVQQSIHSIDAGDYGWCEETGEPIGVPRLLARPTATLSLEAQQRREMKQKLYGD